MHRIDTAGNVGGLFRNPDPILGYIPVVADDAWLNDVQENIVAVILAAGIGLVKGNYGQLLAAINWLIAAAVVTATTGVAGIVKLASGADVLAGTSAVLAVTPASLTSQQSLTANGYNTEPGGLIKEWGTSSSLAHAATQNITFPFALPNNAFVATVNATHQDATAEALLGAVSLTQTGMQVENTSFTSQPLYWEVKGN